MDILSRTNLLVNDLPSQEKKVAKYILNNYQHVPRQTIHELACKAGVSSPTVSRLVKRMGINSFSEFKLRILESNTEKIFTDMHTELNSSVITTLQLIIDKINLQEIKIFQNQILSAKRILIYIKSDNITIGKKIQRFMFENNIPVVFLTEEKLEDLSNESDSLILTIGTADRVNWQFLKYIEDKSLQYLIISNAVPRAFSPNAILSKLNSIEIDFDLFVLIFIELIINEIT